MKTIYERILAESQRLDKEIKSLQEQIKKLPEGDFFCTKNKKYYKWYKTDGKVSTYIPKKDRSLAEKLATKKYLSLKCEDLRHEKCALDFYLRHHNSNEDCAEKLLCENPEYQNLLLPNFKPLSIELQEWAGASYIQNSNYPENLNIKTSSGRFVRSKSEAIIDTLLFVNKIPFRYECLLRLNNKDIYPDFTIRHPKTGKTYYWEHFGMIDDPDYAQKTCSKIQLYMSNGIYPSIQLITTYETKENPLSIETVSKIIEYYFD